MKSWKHITIVALLLLAGSGCDFGTATRASGGGTGVEGLTGTLVTPSGAPAVGAQIRVYTVTSSGAPLAKSSSAGVTAADTAIATATASATGSFQFRNLANGTYNIAGTFQSGDTTLSVFVRNVVVVGNTDLGTDTLRVSGGLNVQIRAGGYALPGATCLVPASPWQAVSDASGNCVLTALPPGVFQITVSYPGLVLFVSGNLNVASGIVSNAGTITLPGSGGNDSLLPPVAMLQSPAQNATDVAISPSLMWWNSIMSVNPATLSYRLQVATDSAFTTFLVNDTTRPTVLSPGALSRGIGPLAYNNSYYWRVITSNAHGSRTSATGRFTTTTGVFPPAPTLIYPYSGALFVDATPTFTWDSVPGATAYHFQMIGSNHATIIIGEDSTLTVPRRVYGPLELFVGYSWRVRARNSVGWGPWTEYVTFSRDNMPVMPETPVLSSPAQNATGLSLTPTFVWRQMSTAQAYHLQIHTDTAFTNPLVNDTVPQPLSAGTLVSRAIGPLTGNTTYYWRVRTWNSLATSAWSEVRRFTTTSAGSDSLPATPVLASPAQFATGLSRTPSLTWNLATGASTYHLQVATVSSFSTLLVNDTLGPTLPAVPFVNITLDSLANNTTYYWRVRASNAAGNGAWSEVRQFTTGPGSVTPPADTFSTVPTVPNLLTPAQFATNVSTAPTLTWEASARATSYSIQVSLSTTFATLVVNDTGVTTTSRTLSPLAGNTDYYWRVSARNAAGSSAYATIRRFTTGTAP